MSSEYTRVATDAVEEKERRGGGASSRDIAGALGAEHVTLRCWRYGPGQTMAYHRHKTQEELYRLVSGGPQHVQIGDELVEVQDGDWLRLPKDTPRRIMNNSTDRDAIWITIGCPPGDGIMDGIRLDPETGQEIPRSS
jgi:quercetin dioxygenase-like cupin family protein